MNDFSQGNKCPLASVWLQLCLSVYGEANNNNNDINYNNNNNHCKPSDYNEITYNGQQVAFGANKPTRHKQFRYKLELNCGLD